MRKTNETMEFDFNSQLITSRQYLDNFARKFALEEDDRKDLVSETILKALDNLLRERYKSSPYYQTGSICTPTK